MLTDRGLLPNRSGTPNSKVDVPGVVGQFLSDLEPTDLVVELVQNDLDAGSTATRIEFGPDSISSQGNGKQIDDEGWTRLEYVLGAGGEIEAKKDGIGSKNHGLRSVFLIADEIGIQSNGLRVDLTTRGLTDQPEKFFPAAWDRAADPDAPTEGTLVTAPYRKRRILKPDGDGDYLEPPLPNELDGLWAVAVREAPERFICASPPSSYWNYELTLARSGHPAATFIFECKPLAGAFRGLWLRTCKLKTEGKAARILLRRHCARFKIEPEILGQGKVPKLFRKAKNVYGELSWIVDRKERPRASTGLLRYPIAFPPESALTGAGFDISAPFIAGRARHSLSDAARNSLLVRTGRGAFAQLAGNHLARAYGPALGVLAQSFDRPDEARSDDMAAMLLATGGLSVAVRSHNLPRTIVGSAPMDAGRPLTLAASVRAAHTLDKKLCVLAPETAQVLHPDTPPDLVCRVAKTAGAQIVRFDEESAATQVFVSGLRPGIHVDERRIGICSEVLLALERLRRGGGVPHSLVAELKKNGSLPIANGMVTAWADVRRSEKPAPQIPGMVDPPIVHPLLLKSTVLRERPLRLPSFDLNEFVSTKDFKPVAGVGRQRFFNWLKANTANLRTSTLKTIADYPIWPGTDGEHRMLDYYCRPRVRILNELLGELTVDPSRDVVSIVGSKAARGAWKLRDQPRVAELVSWYQRCSDQIVRLIERGDQDAAELALRKLEDSLETLRTKLEIPIGEVAVGHKTFSQAGKLALVSDLHAPTLVVRACGLAPEALCRPRHLDLYEALKALQRPSAASLVQAMRGDANPSKLFIRLEEYKRSGRDLSELAGEKIIRVGSGLHAAEDLAFRAEPDLWGRWKVRLDRTSDVAEHHGLLASLGVTQANLKGGQSQAFFSWLAAQNREVQRDHLPQILRHWRDKSFGPLQWASGYRQIPCVPVHGKGLNFELVPLSEATNARRSIFLDDFPEIRDAVLRDGRLRITHHAVGNQGSVLFEFATSGVPSLRQAAGQASSISVTGAVEVPADLTRELAHLQSGPIRSSLKARLPTFGVPLSEIKADIQKLIKDLKGVRVGDTLLALYVVAGRQFEVPVGSGIDAASSMVCVATDADRLTDFYGAMAGHIFKSGSSPLNAWGLLRAVRDRRHASLFEIEEYVEDDEVDTIGHDPLVEGVEQLRKGHGANVESLIPVVPAPKALKPITTPTYLNRVKRRPSPPGNGASTDGLRNSIEEEEQIRALKEEHYAWHCQACLGERDVLKLAPPGTYIFAPGYRRRLLHAHHAQQLQNQGALGGRNLIILCSYHHDLWGDHISRLNILNGLEDAVETTRAFPRDSEGKDLERRRGLVASIVIDIEPYLARLYFTKLHADAWQA